MNELLNLAPQASTFAERIDPLHVQIFIATMVVFALILGAVAYLMWKYKRTSAQQVTEDVHLPNWLEVAIIAVPFVVFMGWFTWGFRDYVWLQTPPKDAIDVYVIGKKWMWKYSYPEGPNSIDTLRVPAGKPVRLLITSRDVLHSFYVPAFRVKKDALPGRYSETWFQATKPGTYPIFCAEYCGLNHSTMIGEVVVMPPDAYEKFINDGKATVYAQSGTDNPATSMALHGQRLSLEKGCNTCHSTDGTRLTGPSFQGLYGSERPLASGQIAKADAEYLSRSITDPAADRVAGYEATMPSYGNLSPTETAALLEYLKTMRAEEQRIVGAMR